VGGRGSKSYRTREPPFEHASVALSGPVLSVSPMPCSNGEALLWTVFFFSTQLQEVVSASSLTLFLGKDQTVLLKLDPSASSFSKRREAPIEMRRVLGLSFTGSYDHHPQSITINAMGYEVGERKKFKFLHSKVSRSKSR
jgi:hypothetical protein